MTNEDARLHKIRALLLKAERTEHPEEAKSFTAKAEELMVRWAIDDAMLADAKDAQAQAVESMKIDIVGGPPYEGTKINLLVEIAYAHDCKIVIGRANTWVEGKQKRASRATIVGFRRELEFIEMLYTSCTLQAQQEFQSDAIQKQLFADAPHPGNRIRWRNSFMQGYGNAIGYRLRQMRRTTVDATPGAGLVLANAKGRVDDAFAEMFPRLGTRAASTRRNFTTGLVMGGEAGRRADLGAGRGVRGNKGVIER